MLSVEEALEQILSRVRPLGTELVELTAALGRVLAEPVVSRRELPPWPNSSMDGYAIRAADTRASGAKLVVVGRIIAGSMPARALRSGEAMRIFTGAPLPDGADAVVPQEDVTGDDARVTIPERVEAGACVSTAGHASPCSRPATSSPSSAPSPNRARSRTRTPTRSWRRRSRRALCR